MICFISGGKTIKYKAQNGQEVIGEKHTGSMTKIIGIIIHVGLFNLLYALYIKRSQPLMWSKLGKYELNK